MMLTTLRRSPARRSAFTLLEVLVVVAILVILATVATIATTKYIEEARKSKAQLGCTTLDKAIKTYVMSSSNPGVTEEEKLPTSPQDLVTPFGTNTSYLDNGPADTVDPWGKPYQFERRTRSDGQTMFILVHTTAPDGTPISQFGIGPNANPKY
jgi:general secretion pathway protein G